MNNDKYAPPIPDKKPLDSLYRPPILKGVPNEEIYKFTRKHEWPVPHLYKDTEDKVAVGIGKMIPNASKAQDLPFYIMKDKDTPLRRATKKEIEQAFEKISKAPKGEKWPYYDPFKNSKLDKVHLSEDRMNYEVDEDLRRSANELRVQIPRFDLFDQNAQKALLDMQFNIGNSKFNARKWPGLFKAIDNQDWLKAAKESHRFQVDESRNKDVYDLFIKAARTEQDRR